MLAAIFVQVCIYPCSLDFRTWEWTRGAPWKEGGKPLMGKELERMRSFSSRSSEVLAMLISRLGPKSWRTGGKEGRTGKNGLEDLERGAQGHSWSFKILISGDIPFQNPFETCFHTILPRFSSRSSLYSTPFKDLLSVVLVLVSHQSSKRAISCSIMSPP